MATATKPETPATSPKHPKFTLTAPRSVLREALGKLLSVIPTAKVQIPVLACVLIEVPDTIEAMIARADSDPARPEAVRLTGTNMDAVVSLSVPAEVTGVGRAVLPAKRLLDIVASLPEGARVTITVDGLTAKIRSGRSAFALSGMPVAEFPTAPEIAPGASLAVAKGPFIAAVSRAVKLSSPTGQRPVVDTVRLGMTRGHLTATATDGHSLGRFPIGEPGPDALASEALFPRDIVPSFARLFADVPDDAPMIFATDTYRARLTAGDITLQCRLVTGPYPQVDPMVPTGTRHTVVCDRQALADTLRRVALASDQTRRVTCTIAPAEQMDGVSELRLVSASEEGGTADDVVLLASHDRHDGAGEETISFAANANKLVLALDSLTSESVAMHLVTPERAIVFRTSDQAPDDPTVMLVMPLRML